jgi:hypothetical protein
MPILPATTLAPDCYSSMFSGCSSLTKAPFIAATVLKGTMWIFNDCSSLTNNIDLRHVTQLTEACGVLISNSNIAVLFGPSLTSIPENSSAFTPLIDTGSRVYNYYYYFTDNDTVSFTLSNGFIPIGREKAPYTTNIYTDNTAIKDAALTRIDQYTTVNVYHLDGSDW